MTTSVRWGILGAAKFAREHMGPAIHAAQDAVLHGVASRDVTRVAPFQRFAPEVCAYDTYEALLADPNIDAVYIPLPNPLHVPWALKAMAAGKHVLIEKPAAMHTRDFDDLIAARDKAGVMAAEALMIAHHPQWQRAAAVIADGTIGDLVQIGGHFCYDNGHDPDNIRNQPDFGGGGLRDIGVYIFGGARLVTGAELDVQSALMRRVADFDTFTEVHALVGGVPYSAYVSTRAFAHQEMRFHGTQGMLRLTAPFNPQVFGEASLELSLPKNTVQVERFPAPNHYKMQVEAFGRAMRGADYVWPLERARGTQQTIDAVFDLASPLD